MIVGLSSRNLSDQIDNHQDDSGQLLFIDLETTILVGR